MRRLAFLVLLTALAACTEFNPGPPDRTKAPRAFVTTVLDIMEANSARKALVNWQALRDTVMGSIPPRAVRIPEVLPAIALALELQGDNNSWLRLPEGTLLPYPHTNNCTGSGGKLIAEMDSIGYLAVGPVHPPTSTYNPYINTMQVTMAAQDAPGLIGWVIDLRENDSATHWPLLVAIWPFLQGTVGFFMYSDGSMASWRVQGDVVSSDGALIGFANNPYTPLTPPNRVAVLTDASTSAYGEAIAIAFRGRSATRSFGSATCGLTTGVSTFPLSDEYTLGLAVVTMADRNQQRYDGPVVPDEIVTTPDSLLARAVAWLRSPTP